MKFSLSRDPALWLFAFASIVRLFAAFIVDLNADQQAVLNAGATAVASMIVAVWVRKEGQVPAILGVVQACLALAVGFGTNLSAEEQVIIMTAVGGLAAAFIRTQVVAPKTIDGQVVPKQPIGA